MDLADDAAGRPRPGRLAAKLPGRATAPDGDPREDPRHRRGRVHQRLSRPGAPRRRSRGDRARRLQQVRPAVQVVRRASALPVRRGRRQGRGPDARAGRRLRPGRGRRGDDRRDQLLPRVRVRPARRERADPRLDVRRGHRRPPRRPSPADHRGLVIDGLRVRDRVPDAGRRRGDVAAAGLDVRVPEARVGVLRQGRMGAVPAPVHDRAALQLRRDRRTPGAARHRHHVRQREAGPLPCRPGPRAQGHEGPGPAAHPRRRIAGAALHLRRGPRPRDPPGHGIAGGDRRGLQPLDRRVDDRPRARRGRSGARSTARTDRSGS